MPPPGLFGPKEAEELSVALAAEGVDYLYIGAYAAILLGAPAITQDVDIFLPKAHSRENGEKVIRALEKLGFKLDLIAIMSILTGSEFVLLRSGPYDLDFLHAPDGIDSFEGAEKRKVMVDGKFPVVSVDDLIASKQAAGREKDIAIMPMLERLRLELRAREADQA